MRALTGHMRTLEKMMKTRILWMEAVSMGLGILALVSMTLLQSGSVIG